MTATTAAVSDPHVGERRIRVAIVGAGFSGIAMALAMVRQGRRHDLVILDSAEEFGGTWRDNIYPGCACDVPSHLYSLADEPWDWPDFYSHQPEIQRYLLAVVARNDLRRHARLGVTVTRQEWVEEEAHWRITLDDDSVIEAEVVVNGVGPLRRPVLPDLPGIEDFTGTWFHSSNWPSDLDVSGQRVGIVGTGASAVQIVPAIAGEAGHVEVFQRTASWVLPRTERHFSRFERFVLRRSSLARRFIRRFVFTVVERLLWRVLAMDSRAQRAARRAGEANIRRGIDDPTLREAVTPDLAPGCKRIMFSNTWYPTLGRDDVTLRTSGIARVTSSGVTLDDGSEVELDTLVYGTGFDPHHFWFPITIIGRDGRTLAEQWSEAPLAHLGTTVPGFPNLFFLLGPNTGTGHNSVVLMAEAQAAYVLQALDLLRRGDTRSLAPTEEATSAFADDTAARHEDLVWASGCGSWYLNEAGVNDTIYPGPVRDFQERLRTFDREHYQSA